MLIIHILNTAWAGNLPILPMVFVGGLIKGVNLASAGDIIVGIVGKARKKCPCLPADKLQGQVGWALVHLLDYFVLFDRAIASCRNVSAFSPNGSNAATASSASFFAICLDFSIPTTAG